MKAAEKAHWKKQVEYWTSKRSEYQFKLDQAKEKLEEASIALAPYQAGQEVEFNYRGTWVPALVRVVNPKGWGTYWFRVSLRKKDGAWAERVQSVYSVGELRLAQR